jgi:hypothetical protein
MSRGVPALGTLCQIQGCVPPARPTLQIRGFSAADATRAQAQADADAARLRGEAGADAIRAKGAALRDNPTLIALTSAERWNGILPTTMVPGGAVPFVNVGK